MSYELDPNLREDLRLKLTVKRLEAEVERLKKSVEEWNDFADTIGFDVPHTPQSFANLIAKERRQVERLKDALIQIHASAEDNPIKMLVEYALEEEA